MTLLHAPVVPKRTGWPGGGVCADAYQPRRAVSIAVSIADFHSVFIVSSLNFLGGAKFLGSCFLLKRSEDHRLCSWTARVGKHTCPVPQYGPVAVALIHDSFCPGFFQTVWTSPRDSVEGTGSPRSGGVHSKIRKTDLASDERNYYFSLCFHVTRITQQHDSVFFSAQ